MTPVDLLTPAQDAVYDALKVLPGRPGLPSDLEVFQHPPERVPGAPFAPYLMIGNLSSKTEEEHGEQAEMITVEVIGAYRGGQRRVLLAMMATARAVLDGQSIAADGASFEPPRWQGTEASDAIADGETYLALATFETLATPA